MVTRACSKIYLKGGDKCLLKMYLLQIPVAHTPSIPALWRLRQGDLEFEANIGYIVICCLKNQKAKPRA